QTQGKPVCNTAFDIWTSKAPSAKGVGFTHSPSFNAETALFGTCILKTRRVHDTRPFNAKLALTENPASSP
ncbi:hypothetical protein, partial [Ensifer sp. ENS02]|uniref:hypothetical protein n=1 Tax=Ensifer sp. ENS02 TaxID=2769290 RepID=UPI001AEE257D